MGMPPYGFPKLLKVDDPSTALAAGRITQRGQERPGSKEELRMSDNPIAVGQPAPEFSLAASVGLSPLSLADLRGKTVVLAFYVLDFTDT